MIGVGIAAILSGDYAPLGREMKVAAEIAIDECNAAGGICGSAVSTHVVDDQADVEEGRKVARELCGRSEVLGVVGHFGSDASIAASEIYRECGLAMITPIASNPKLTERRLSNVFRFTNSDDRAAQAIAGYLFNNLGKRRAVIVQTDYAYGKSMAGHFAETFSIMGGETVRREDIAVGQCHFDDLLSRLPTQFDVLFYGGAFEGAYLLKAMRRHGFAQLCAAGDAASVGEGVLILSATPTSGRSAHFVDNYERRNGPITNYAVNSYDSTRLLLASIRAAARAERSGDELRVHFGVERLGRLEHLQVLFELGAVVRCSQDDGDGLRL